MISTHLGFKNLHKETDVVLVSLYIFDVRRKLSKMRASEIPVASLEKVYFWAR
jgi:hypothetical protein